MSVENSIILITNQDNIVETLKPKLVLLREVDHILAVDYKNAIDKIKEVSPEAVIIYSSNENEDCLNIIKEIRQENVTKHTSILLLIDKYNEDFLLSAYDEGITDYLTMSSGDAEILMRTIWGFKKHSQLKTIQKQKQLFEKLDIIDKDTGFFTNKYSEKIFENEFENLDKTDSNAILMLVSVGETSKIKLHSQQLASAIKTSIRHSDVVVHGTAQKFYVLLVETQLKGAFRVWEKIKQSLGSQYNVLSSIKSVEGESFDELQKCLLNGLVEAESTGQDLVIVSEEEKNISSGDWLEKINSTQKNFKLFKQAFNKKLENVIAPVFFQMQKAYEAKLFETQIEQYSNSTLSEFVLKKADKISELKITYPGFSKINIDIINQGLDSPENKRISLDLTELSDARLTKIIEDFIKEFKSSEG